MRDVPSRNDESGCRQASAHADWICKLGILTTPKVPLRQTVRSACSRAPSGGGELAFPGHPLESFGGALDAVLAVITFRGELAEHLIGAGRGRARDGARRAIEC